MGLITRGKTRLTTGDFEVHSVARGVGLVFVILQVTTVLDVISGIKCDPVKSNQSSVAKLISFTKIPVQWYIRHSRLSCAKWLACRTSSIAMLSTREQQAAVVERVERVRTSIQATSNTAA
ncbi:hypothetical protein IF1G_00333 [Cordyceps javanica]|uniref:Uncharacterized protein n=1 Tax=Cordyceps javanica TaxID=43265 RepID=A0A545VFA3_9HYPO|nr:hypothetical protein IF1G_00333 [Cordyceps javanica]